MNNVKFELPSDDQELKQDVSNVSKIMAKQLVLPNDDKDVGIVTSESSIESANIISDSTGTSQSCTSNGSDTGHSIKTSTTGSTNRTNTSNSKGTDYSSSSGFSGINSTKESYSELKIMDQIKNIEKISSKQRFLLNNTISEHSTDGIASKTISTANGFDNATDNNEVVQLYSRSSTHKEHFDERAPMPASSRHSTPVKSPLMPPPKPPMLSRTRSLGVGDHRLPTVIPTTASNTPTTTRAVSPLEAPFFKPPRTTSPAAAPSVFPSTAPTSPTDAVTFPGAVAAAPSSPSLTVSTVSMGSLPEPVKVTTLQLKPDSPVLRRIERPLSASASSPKEIAVNHYDRLIEELKCPGCASPMKAPILLCQTGHSVCEQCTRILMMCPLCKQPFTTIRSLTVEALCSKAHFRCVNTASGCIVRLQIDLLAWHERQCVYKKMKCFMGRVWGDCQWTGREIDWKQHLEMEHANKVFNTDNTDLIWNMGVPQKPLTGYYVFNVFDEMFNFYEVYDKERVLFTMTCTSNLKDKKYHFAYEVALIHHNNEALAITQKFPVHSEYDKDILMDGTCVSIPVNDLAKFIDEDRLLHYRVRVLQVKSPRKSKPTSNSVLHPLDFQLTQIEGVNLKNVPVESIVTRKLDSANGVVSSLTSSTDKPRCSSEEEIIELRRPLSANINSVPRRGSESDSDPEFEDFISKKWGTPQLHFNRKFLKNNGSETSSNDEANAQVKMNDTLDKRIKKLSTADRISISSTSTNYKTKVANRLRNSFRSLKTEITEMRPFSKKTKSGDK